MGVRDTWYSEYITSVFPSSRSLAWPQAGKLRQLTEMSERQIVYVDSSILLLNSDESMFPKIVRSNAG